MLARERSGRIMNRDNICTEPTWGRYSPITTLIKGYYDVFKFIPRIEDFGFRVCCLNYESSKTPNETNSIALSRKENAKC